MCMMLCIFFNGWMSFIDIQLLTVCKDLLGEPTYYEVSYYFSSMHNYFKIENEQNSFGTNRQIVPSKNEKPQ